MRKLVLFLAAVMLTSSAAMAQDDEREGGFKKENLFTGGSVTVSFFNGQTILGANPMFGYKLNDYIDAGIAINFVSNTMRDYYAYDDKIKQTVWGPGVFTRVYPIPFLFLQAQVEQNFSSYKYTPAPGSSMSAQKDNTDATSLLLGGGFASGRQKGGTSFFYISLLFDVLKDRDSPYVNVSYNPSDPNQSRVDVVPIIRAGVNIGLFQGRY